ncbi:Uncharacterised protein [Mycobacteroides abscessus subsp. abscessus]|nr:hypothetical protein [Mycobacteroides abscessus]SIB21925.1 Uncharacterised protein [Mycobacteroides abscessus subsp. abscessus]SIC35987.1 Uncharacterised protein [Mycobacteroides abscessus subsp. abscessus]SIE80512.1 Uncharacterised protein [Mycobacteroides abscessus subsp. abscessus]SIM58493.1 Uncharacterised protein [Mycobacteroides abscessus subsp. abscessus]
MKNSPMSEASLRAAFWLSGSAPANSLRSNRPSRMLPLGAAGLVSSADPYVNLRASDCTQPWGTTKLNPPWSLLTRPPSAGAPGAGGGVGGAGWPGAGAGGGVVTVVGVSGFGAGCPGAGVAGGVGGGGASVVTRWIFAVRTVAGAWSTGVAARVYAPAPDSEVTAMVAAITRARCVRFAADVARGCCMPMNVPVCRARASVSGNRRARFAESHGLRPCAIIRRGEKGFG